MFFQLNLLFLLHLNYPVEQSDAINMNSIGWADAICMAKEYLTPYPSNRLSDAITNLGGMLSDAKTLVRRNKSLASKTLVRRNKSLASGLTVSAQD